MLLLIVNNTVSHNDSPMAELREEGAQDTNQVPGGFPPLPATVIEKPSWLTCPMSWLCLGTGAKT